MLPPYVSGGAPSVKAGAAGAGDSALIPASSPARVWPPWSIAHLKPPGLAFRYSHAYLYGACKRYSAALQYGPRGAPRTPLPVLRFRGIALCMLADGGDGYSGTYFCSQAETYSIAMRRAKVWHTQAGRRGRPSPANRIHAKIWSALIAAKAEDACVTCRDRIGGADWSSRLPYDRHLEAILDSGGWGKSQRSWCLRERRGLDGGSGARRQRSRRRRVCI